MWSALLLYFASVYLLKAQEVPQNESYKCAIPQHPKHGVVIVTEPIDPDLYSTPGDKVANYNVEIFCDLGYENLGVNYQRCAEDGMISGNTDMECLPYCEPQDDDRVLSCGGSPRCVKLPATCPTPTVGSRANFGDGAEDDECGIISDQQTSTSSALILKPGAYAPYVSGGRSATRVELPWHAGVYAKSKRPYMQICGGSVLSHAVVISAGHCFWDEVEKQLPATQYAVAAGKLYRPWNEPNDNNAQKSDVSEIKIPPYFQGHTTNLQDDIALLILATPFVYNKFVRPVCLNFDPEEDNEDLTPGTFGKVGGWGLTSEDGPASQVLKVVNLPVVDLTKCFEQSDPAFRSHITSDKICAGFRNGTAVCKGDSGGGLAFLSARRGRARYSLRGLVSGSPQSEHLCNTLAWASFTHLLTHQRFITETIFQPLQEAQTRVSAEEAQAAFRDLLPPPLQALKKIKREAEEAKGETKGTRKHPKW